MSLEARPVIRPTGIGIDPDLDGLIETSKGSKAAARVGKTSVKTMTNGVISKRSGGSSTFCDSSAVLAGAFALALAF